MEVDKSENEVILTIADKEVGTTLEETADIRDERKNNKDALDDEVSKQEANNIEREEKVVSENDKGMNEEPTTAENSNRRTSSSSFETKSTAGEEDPRRTDDEGNTSFSLRDLGCDHAKYLSIKNDIRSASSSVLMKL